MKTRKIPMRMCVGCREMKEKKSLMRIVRSAQDGAIHFDRTGKLPGRGAYLCRSRECLEKAVKQKQLERALEVRIEDAVFAQLSEELDAD